MGAANEVMVSDVMTTKIITISEDARIQELAALLLEKRISGVPVLSHGGALVGIVTVTDLYKVLKNRHFDKTFGKFFHKEPITQVKDIMSREVFTVEPTYSMEQLVSIAIYKSIHTIPVMDNGKMVGVVGMKDILNYGLNGL